MGSPDTRLDGRIINGRTYEDEDGTLKELDLSRVQTGDEVVIINEEGIRTTFIRGDTSERPSAHHGWARGVGAVAVSTLVFLQHNERRSDAPPFRRAGVVLRRGMGVGVLDALSDNPNVIEDLGVAAAIEYTPAADSDDIFIQRAQASGLVS